MRKKVPIAVLSCLFLLYPLVGMSQMELGVRFGLATYMGDLADRFVPSESHPAGGIMMRLNLSSKWKSRFSATYGTVSGFDLDNNPETNNNLNFKSSVIELAAEMEYDFLPFLPGSPNLTFTPYIFGGVAGFKFNPLAEYQGSYLQLQPIGTEGQTIAGSNLQPYSLYNISFPFGLGFKKSVSDGVIFGVELGFRPTLTDYLDDVSGNYPDFTELAQTEYGNVAVELSDRRPEANLDAATSGSLRGNPNNRDWYGFLLISITKRLGSSPCYTF